MCHSRVKYVDELRERLISVRCELDQSVVNHDIDINCFVLGSISYRCMLKVKLFVYLYKLILTHVQILIENITVSFSFYIYLIILFREITPDHTNLHNFLT